MSASLVGHPNKWGSPLNAEVLLSFSFTFLFPYAFFSNSVKWAWKRTFHLAFVSCRIVHVVLFSAPHWNTSCWGLHFNGGAASSSAQRYCVCHCSVWEGTTISITDHNGLSCFCGCDLKLPHLTVLVNTQLSLGVWEMLLHVWVCRCCWVYMKRSHRPPLPFPLPLMTTHPYELHNQAGPRSYWKLSLKQITCQRMGLREGSKL